jgi:hypothetical protein
MAAITQRGESWYVQVRIKGFKLNKTFMNEDSAKQWADKTESDIKNGAMIYKGNFVSFKQLRKMYRATLERSRDTGKEHTLTMEELQLLWERSQGRCEVSGITFSDYKPVGSHRRPFFPSIDRIDSKLGYTLDNSRLICVMANIAKCDYTDHELYVLAKGIVENYGGNKKRVLAA